jgi:hypothetical protein
VAAWEMAKGIAGSDQKKAQLQKIITLLKVHMGDDEGS